MALEKVVFVDGGSEGLPAVKLTKLGHISLNGAFVKMFSMDKYLFCEVFHEKGERGEKPYVQIRFFFDNSKDKRFGVVPGKGRGATSAMIKCGYALSLRGVQFPPKPVTVPYRFESSDILNIYIPGKPQNAE